MTPIRCGDYKSLCDSVFDSDDISSPPPSGLVYVPLDRIYQFFRLLKDSGTDNRYILVSARSDFGLAYQRENPLWYDMAKWIPFLQNDGGLPKLGYNPLIVPPRGKMENCKADDKFSVKCYSFTEATFDDIPENVVKWYCVNANILHPKVKSLPFGIQEQADISLFAGLSSREKFDAIYVNFACNTNERLRLSNFFLSNTDKIPASVVTKSKSYSEYLNDISRFRYVLCPPGNGYDSYRIWETLYVGSIPVVFSDYWNEDFSGLPLIRISEKYLYNLDILNYLHELDSGMDDDCKMLDFEYWRKEFTIDRENLKKT